MKEVKESQAKMGISDANFIKLLYRLNYNLKGKDGLKYVLPIIPTHNQNINELILYYFISLMLTNKLDAYRFSE